MSASVGFGVSVSCPRSELHTYLYIVAHIMLSCSTTVALYTCQYFKAVLIVPQVRLEVCRTFSQSLVCSETRFQLIKRNTTTRTNKHTHTGTGHRHLLRQPTILAFSHSFLSFTQCTYATPTHTRYIYHERACLLGGESISLG